MQYKLIFLLMVMSFGLSAQTNTYSSSKDSDARAVAILQKLKQKYGQTNTQVTSSFSLKMEFPNKTTRIEKGSIMQFGKKFNLDIQDMAVINDGSSVWFINKKQKEVQINDYSPNVNQGIINPADFINQYDKKNFVVALTYDGLKGGKKVQIIEAKPVNRKTDYSKARITVNKTTGELSVLEVFNKDGSRHTLTISKTTMSKTPSSTAYTFNNAGFPGYNIEDLRVN